MGTIVFFLMILHTQSCCTRQVNFGIEKYNFALKAKIELKKETLALILATVVFQIGPNLWCLTFVNVSYDS